MQYDGTKPEYFRYILNILQKTKTTETKRVSKVDTKTNPFITS
jgi:hypothetical protein